MNIPAWISPRCLVTFSNSAGKPSTSLYASFQWRKERSVHQVLWGLLNCMVLKKKKKKSDAFLMNTRKSTICVQEHVSSSPPPLANSAANGQLHLCTHACTVYGVWISSIIIKVKKAIAMQSTLKCMILSSSGMCVKFRHCFWCFPLFRCFII